ncbi:MAG TPA: hypothetical protein VLL52_22395 [Anaerolineae bacterium]|nr:hypothetical protein [Anaerolineae bacterium]
MPHFQIRVMMDWFSAIVAFGDYLIKLLSENHADTNFYIQAYVITNKFYNKRKELRVLMEDESLTPEQIDNICQQARRQFEDEYKSFSVLFHEIDDVLMLPGLDLIREGVNRFDKDL